MIDDVSSFTAMMSRDVFSKKRSPWPRDASDPSADLLVHSRMLFCTSPDGTQITLTEADVADHRRFSTVRSLCRMMDSRQFINYLMTDG